MAEAGTALSYILHLSCGGWMRPCMQLHLAACMLLEALPNEKAALPAPTHPLALREGVVALPQLRQHVGAPAQQLAHHRGPRLRRCSLHTCMANVTVWHQWQRHIAPGVAGNPR